MEPTPPLPYRPRGLDVLLGVGVVLVAAAGASWVGGAGGAGGRALVLGLAVASVAASWRSAALSRPRSEEALAAAAVTLGAVAAASGDPLLRGDVRPPAVLAAACLLLHLRLPAAAAWPLGAWGAGQVAVLRALGDRPGAVVPAAVAVGVALLGLALARRARPLATRIVVATAAPWWTAGIAGAVGAAWSGSAADRWLCVAVGTAAVAGLLTAREQAALRPLLGSVAVAVVGGVAAGAVLGAALHLPGTVAVPLAGHLGVVVAALAAALLRGRMRDALLPAATAAGATLVVLSVGQLVVGDRWTALSSLLLVTAALSLVTALTDGADRPVAVPVAVGCAALAALAAVPAGDPVGPRGAAVALSALYAAAVLAATVLAAEARGPTLLVGGACAGAAAVLLGAVGAPGQLALHLAGQGLLTCGWAGLPWWSTRDRGPAGWTPAVEVPPAWRAGVAQLVAAAWTWVFRWEEQVLEAWTLPAALGLLLAAGPRLLTGPSGPAWGPGLWVAAAPSLVAALVQPGQVRPVAVFAASGLAVALAAWRAVRAPLVAGAVTAAVLAAGLLVVRLPAAVGGALVVGALLLWLGGSREPAPAGEGDPQPRTRLWLRLAEMR